MKKIYAGVYKVDGFREYVVEAQNEDEAERLLEEGQGRFWNDFWDGGRFYFDGVYEVTDEYSLEEIRELWDEVDPEPCPKWAD